MSGYHAILRMRRLEEEVNKLGFMFAYPKNRHFDEGDKVSIKPKDAESVLLYARDAEVFCGTLEQLDVWLRGVEWARNYDYLLRVSDEKKRSRKEQDLRNKLLVERLKSREAEQEK